MFKNRKIIRNCIDCILIDKHLGKQGFFIDKSEILLDTYHIGLFSIDKKCRRILVVIDNFNKFTWFYATKFTGTKEFN